MQASIFILIYISLSLRLTLGEWIDPHSMDTNYKKFAQDSSGHKAEKCITVIKKESDSDVHFRRIVRIILNNAYLDNDLGYHEGYINIKLSATEHELLVNFSQGDKLKDDVVGEIGHILENAFQKPISERYEESILSFQEKLYGIVFNPTSTALFGATVTLLITYKLLKAQFTLKSIFKYFAILAYITDFLVTYLNILREGEVESIVNLKTLGPVPPECDPQKMSWWGAIKTQFQSTFTENPCRAYYQATYQSYMYLATPSKVLTRQFKSVVLDPLGDVGEAFGRFGRSMFSSLPFGLNVVLFPMMLMTTCGLVFMAFLFIAKPHFKMSLLHFFTVEVGNQSKNETLHVLKLNQESSSNKAITYAPNRSKNRKQVGLTRNHRALVEEISHDSSSSHGPKKIIKSKRNCNESRKEISKKAADSTHAIKSDDCIEFANK